MVRSTRTPPNPRALLCNAPPTLQSMTEFCESCSHLAHQVAKGYQLRQFALQSPVCSIVCSCESALGASVNRSHKIMATNRSRLLHMMIIMLMMIVVMLMIMIGIINTVFRMRNMEVLAESQADNLKRHTGKKLNLSHRNHQEEIKLPSRKQSFHIGIKT